MNTLIYILALTTLLMSGHDTVVSQMKSPVESLPRVESLGQNDHALELFRRLSFSYILTDSKTDMRLYVMAAVQASLPAAFHDRALEIARAVIEEGNQHNMDPFFLLAVMKTESKFDLDVIGTHGEIGLMQILPGTAAWLAPQAGLAQNFDLHDPATNIRLGATYIAQLRKKFSNQPQRYVGAYNMGPRNVRRLMASNSEPQIYPAKVLNHYRDFYRVVSRALSVATTKLALQTPLGNVEE